MNLADNLFTTAEKFENRRAIVFYDRVINYAQLRECVALLAMAFAERGLGPGERLAIALPNVPQFIAAYYAAFTTGAQVVPINPQYTRREMDFMLSDSRARIIVTHPMFEQSVREAIAGKKVELIYSDNLGDPAKLCFSDLIKAQTQEMEPVRRNPDDVAVVAYTNAVDGFPMGAQLTHEGLDFDTESCKSMAVVDENDAFLTVLPLYHAFSATVCMHLPLKYGAVTILNETFSEKRVVDILESEPISIFPAVPTIFSKIYEVYGGAGKDFSKIKAFVPGGAPCDTELIKKFSTAFNASVYEGYGITECGPVTAANPIREKKSKPGSVGVPLDGIQVAIRDPQGNDLPAKTEGELWIKGKNVMKGYLDKPEATAANLIGGWFRSGDRAYIDEDGFIFITGLIKRMALVGGFNAYPAEIEMILADHPAVEKCEAFSIEDHNLGQRVGARVTLKPGATATPQELRKFSRTLLAPYKVPKTIEIT